MLKIKEELKEIIVDTFEAILNGFKKIITFPVRILAWSAKALIEILEAER